MAEQLADGPGKTDGPCSELHGDLGWMLGAVFRAYAKAFDHAVAELPGGPRGYQVLTAAASDPPVNQGAISEELGIDRTVLTYLIDDLERAGLVSRRPDPADRRSRLIIATDTGRAAWKQLQEARRQIEAHVLSPLSPAEVEQFLGLLRQAACRAQAVDPLRGLCEVVEQVRPAQAG